MLLWLMVYCVLENQKYERIIYMRIYIEIFEVPTTCFEICTSMYISVYSLRHSKKGIAWFMKFQYDECRGNTGLVTRFFWYLVVTDVSWVWGVCNNDNVHLGNENADSSKEALF